MTKGLFGILAAMAAAAILSTAYLKADPAATQANILARKAAAEMRLIQKAAGNFRRDNGTWPGDMAELRGAGYLPGWFPSDNPWGNPYILAPSGNNITVSCDLPANVHNVAARLLPSTSVAGDTLTSEVPPPGQEPVFDKFLRKAGDATGRTMRDDLIMGGNRVRDVGNATDPDDGLPMGQADGVYVLSSGDTMSGDLTVRGRLNATRFEDRDDPTYHFDPGGGSNLNLVYVDDIYYSALGKYGSELLDRPGNWDCYIASSAGTTCCAAGYVMIDTAGANENSQGCYFSTSGGRQCAYCRGNTYLICCR